MINRERKKQTSRAFRCALGAESAKCRRTTTAGCFDSICAGMLRWRAQFHLLSPLINRARLSQTADLPRSCGPEKGAMQIPTKKRGARPSPFCEAFHLSRDSSFVGAFDPLRLECAPWARHRLNWYYVVGLL